MNLRKLSKNEFDAVIRKQNKLDIDISKISSCQCKSMDECEKHCGKYYGCSTIAYANDILITYDESLDSHE